MIVSAAEISPSDKRFSNPSWQAETISGLEKSRRIFFSSAKAMIVS